MAYDNGAGHGGPLLTLECHARNPHWMNASMLVRHINLHASLLLPATVVYGRVMLSPGGAGVRAPVEPIKNNRGTRVKRVTFAWERGTVRER